MLVRILRRTGEIATRLALGASRWRILGQLWIESLLLAVVGGGAGIAAGFIALRGLLTLLPEHFLPVAAVPLDSRVLAFTLSLSLLTSVLFGMLPALSTRRVDLRSSIGSRALIGAGSLHLRHGLIAGEVALTVVLLAAAGLLIRTLVHLETMTPGFNPNGVMTAKTSLDNVQYRDPVPFRKLLDKSLAAIRQIPGVQNAAVGLTLPYERALIDGVTIPSSRNLGHEISTDEVYVTPGYFETLSIPLLAGRTFTDADGPTDDHALRVNRTFSRKFFQGTNPLGQYLRQDNRNLLVIRVVGDTLGSSAARLTADNSPLVSDETIYIAAAQLDSQFLSLVHTFFQPSWIVRTAGAVERLTPLMQRALSSADPNLPFSGFYDMRDLMMTTLATQNIEVALLARMASLALSLSAVGIFSLVSNMVVQRTREIGIRMALGSTVGQAMLRMGRAGVSASLTGVVLGLTISAGVLRLMRSALFGVSAYDAPTLASVVFTLFFVTVLATVVPTLKIANIDPATTLREE
jgi:macrolide transport system ATP-binding/permease protein